MSDVQRRSLAGFTGAGYDKGRSAPVQALWLLLSGLFVTRWWCPMGLRLGILRMFGATIGEGVVLRHRVHVHWPWKLTIGDHCWIGRCAFCAIERASWPATVRRFALAPACPWAASSSCAPRWALPA